jgi:hypothetical protein
MLNESRLNIYVLGSDLSRRQRERIQAQVHTGLRSLPTWVFDLLRQRIDALGIANLPLIIEPQTAGSTHRVLSLGRIEARPTVKLTPRLLAEGLDWGQDLTRLLAKAVAYVTAPDERDTDFWRRWKEAADGDRLREKAVAVAGEYRDETDLGLFIELFAAYVLSPEHHRWPELARVHSFLDRWRRYGG